MERLKRGCKQATAPPTRCCRRLGSLQQPGSLVVELVIFLCAVRWWGGGGGGEGEGWGVGGLRRVRGVQSKGCLCSQGCLLRCQRAGWWGRRGKDRRLLLCRRQGTAGIGWEKCNTALPEQLPSSCPALALK